jgi:sialate O-acetylesterase
MRHLLAYFLLLPFYTSAQLKLSAVFNSNMVLQSDKPVTVWGRATPGKSVEVRLGTEIGKGLVQADSTWQVIFKPHKAGLQPHTLTASSGIETVRIDNLLFGDIWVCIGQSNMEFPMSGELHYKEELLNCNQPGIRLYNPVYAGKGIYGTKYPDSVISNLTPERFYKGQWQVCDSASLKTMSAVAYYFAKSVFSKTGIPVGIMNYAIGGAPLETFIDVSTLKSDARFIAKTTGDWLLNPSLPVWVRERGGQQIGNVNTAPQDELGKNHPYKPGFAFESGLSSILTLPVKGILCYQGESNAQEMERVLEYAALTRIMVEDYRAKWKQPELPFYFVQLSSIDTIKYKGHLWPSFRDEQRKIQDILPHSGMAVCSDIGLRDDVHPRNKKEVGERLARWALNQDYQLNIIPSGPLPLKAVYKKGKLVIHFRFAAKGLGTSDGTELRGFSDATQNLHAIIRHRKVEIRMASKPEYIYYGWSSWTEANLVNSDRLPASTFKLKVF